MTQARNGILTNQSAIKTSLRSIFIQNAIGNRGLLKSTRRASEVTDRLYGLLCDFAGDASDEASITVAASELAEQGLAFETAGKLMQALNNPAWHDDTQSLAKINNFQIVFLEKLATAHELIEHSIREESHVALQHALHSQLEQQRQLREAQEQHNKKLSQLIDLSSRLSSVKEEQKLLHEAVEGLKKSLNLSIATIYRFDTVSNNWFVQNSTNQNLLEEQRASRKLSVKLNNILHNGNELIEQVSSTPPTQLIGFIVGNVDTRVGALIIEDQSFLDDLPILLRAFSQELSSLWRTAVLFDEMQARNRELEILYGRRVDTLWHGQSAQLHATYNKQGLNVNRNIAEKLTPQDHNAFMIQVGEQMLGHINLPEQLDLTEDDAAFVLDLVHEMGSALNNARLIQTASANSNQLSVAAEVSRRVTTILDRNLLIEQVVELVQERFGLYYVGIFLVEEHGKMAVLKSGTGEAGRIQVTRNFKHLVGGSSMIGTAIALGEAIVEQDVTQAEAFQANPLLPLTKSELALPLRAGDRTIGALTAQHTELGAFPTDTVTVLQSLADQLAIAIENAGLFTQLEDTLSELTATLRETSNLYDTSRRINESTTAKEVYQALVNFVSTSKLADMATVIVEDAQDADFLVAPVLWGSTQRPFNPRDKFLRERFPFSEILGESRLLTINDVWTDPSLDERTRTLFRDNGIRSLTLIPINTEKEWLGSLALCRVHPGRYSQQELQPFRTLADQAAVILANQQLLEQTNALYTINNLLTKAVTRELALAEAVSQVGKYVGLNQCRFILFDKHTEQATLAAATAPEIVPENLRTVPLQDHYIYETLLQTKSSIMLDDADPQIPASCKSAHLERLGVQASYLLPAFSQQELIGYMALDSKRSKRPFSEKNIKFAQTVVEQATIQIENLKLYEDALHRAQDLIMLNQIGSNISGALDLAELPQTVYEQIGQLLDFDIFIFAEVEEESKRYKPILCVENGQFVSFKSAAATINQELEGIIHNNRPTITKENTHSILEPLAAQLNLKPELGVWVTLEREGKTTGFITIQSTDPYAYNTNSAQLLRTIATQTSLAMANAQLFRTVQSNLDDIQAANQKLRELDELKTQFLANMSHELRTPLNSIIGFSRVILKGIDGPITPEQEEDLTTIYKNGQHLLALINEILDMAKIEAGKMTLAFELIEMSELARTVHAITRGLVKQEEIELIWNIATGLPKIEADPIRIRQILINLLSNAVKFTSKGQIELRVDQTKPDFIHIAVRDTGIGIAEEDYDKLFAAFEQVDSSTTRVAGGTGLGLPITNWLINMHGGSITVESELNKGTTFHVQLPIKQQKSKRENAFFSSSISS